jgi:hypothetical protein
MHDPLSSPSKTDALVTGSVKANALIKCGYRSAVKAHGLCCLLIVATSLSAQTERASILNNGNTHVASWAYYTNSGADAAAHRWYISQIASGRVGVYSLGPIVDHQAGWWTVGEAAATVDVLGNQVSINPNLDTDPSDRFLDIGLRQLLNNSLIHSDRKKIQGSTVPIKWFFFQAPNNIWYIVNAPSYGAPVILRFSELNGQYDWKGTDTGDLVPVFSNSGGTKLLKFTLRGVSMYWPLSGSVTSLTSDIETTRAMHKGTDIASVATNVGPTSNDPTWNPRWTFNGKPTTSIYSGGDVYAAAPGTVALIVLSSDTAGRYVVIDHGCGNKTRYLHLYKVAADLKVGQPVTTSTKIGTEGNTGETAGATTGTGCHLHFEFFLDASGGTPNFPDAGEWRSSPVSRIVVQRGSLIPSWSIACP